MQAARFAMILAILGCASMLTLACGGGGGGVGEACDTRGSTEECEEGVCDEEESGAVVCLAICVDQEDCLADEDCNGVSGSNLKACHPKDSPQK